MEIPKDRPVYDRPTSVLWFDDDGILCSLSKKAHPQTLDETKQNIEWLKNFLGGKKVCILSENKYPSHPPDRAIRQLAAEEIPKITKAFAIIAYSPLSKMVANLFFALYPPSYPTKMFTDENEAKKWLKQYL